MKPDLLTFLRQSVRQMEIAFSPERFLEIRYDLFNRAFPHPTFSVEQCSPDFFAVTLAYLTGEREIPPNEKGNIYKNAYLDWVRENRS